MIRQLLSAQDLKEIDYVPAIKLQGFAQDLNRILMDRISRGDENAWNTFLDQTEAFVTKRQLDLGTVTTKQKEVEAISPMNGTLLKTKTEAHERRSHR